MAVVDFYFSTSRLHLFACFIVYECEIFHSRTKVYVHSVREKYGRRAQTREIFSFSLFNNFIFSLFLLAFARGGLIASQKKNKIKRPNKQNKSTYIFINNHAPRVGKGEKYRKITECKNSYLI